MTIFAFIFLSFIAATTLLILNLYKSGLKPFHPPLISLCALLPASFFCANNIYPIGQQSPLWMKWFVVFGVAGTWCIIDLINGFNRQHIAGNAVTQRTGGAEGRGGEFHAETQRRRGEAGEEYHAEAQRRRGDESKKEKKVRGPIIWRILLPIAGVISFFISDSALGIDHGNEILILGSGTTSVFYFQLFLQIYILYLVENTFRSAGAHQRRIGHIFLISLIAIALFQGIFLTRAILYKTVNFPYLAAYVTVTGISFPIALLGLLRVRVGSFEIGISRQSIYSSLSFFAFGAFCLAVGLISLIAHRLNIEFSFFEEFLLLFSAFFFAVLVLLSEDMRRRVRSFVNSHIFVRKFDYREQFFWLHQSYMAGEDVDESIMILTAHLLRTLNYDKIYVFLLNHGDGNFHLRRGPEEEEKTHAEAQRRGEGKNAVIEGDSAITKEFLRDKRPLEFSGTNLEQRERNIREAQREMIDDLGIAAIFPIFNQDTLLGFLAVKYRTEKRLDVEDKMLISIFTVSIGNIFFKYNMLKENIENKQFESFNRLAAFMVHDIKNQVATLSLVMKNAEKNIHNPEFQKSLMVSVKSCANNLQQLVDKLASPPKGDHGGSQSMSINEITEVTINEAGISSMQEIRLTSILHAPSRVPVDKESLFYILKNLIGNALEAMNGRGALTIVSGDCNSFTEKLRKEFNLSDHFLRKYRAYICIEDTGVGMSDEFLEQHLFRPFSTTKDKGIGIGLYQCKVLVEKMGGVLLCASREGEGTKFCILL